ARDYVENFWNGGSKECEIGILLIIEHSLLTTTKFDIDGCTCTIKEIAAERITLLSNRKGWAFFCSFIMVICVFAELMAAVLVIVSWIQPRLMKLVMTVVFAVNFFVFIF
ncbi:hypothetical protein PMAYCL1PPCAC_25356, partial [Pristionchus mayeri]